MAEQRKGLGKIKSVRALLDRRRIRTSGGALMELASLTNERERLLTEMDRLVKRIVEIQARLADIADTEVHLQQFIQGATGDLARPLLVANGPARLITRQLDY
jgi:hypothetical protein